MRIFAVVNQKGGCGKTTTAINLSGVLASRGFRTLLVDMDPQGHCAAGLAIPEQRVDLSIGEAMLAPEDKPVDPARLLWRVMRNLDLAPSTLRLAALEASRGELAGKPDAEQRLKRVLARFDAQYDACLVDCSPAIGLLAFNALVAAHEVIIPVETGFFSLQGASKQINTIKSLGKKLGVAPIHRLLATIHDPTSVLAQDLLEELRRRFGSRVVPVVIRLDNALREAVSFGQPVIEYAPGSPAAEDYSALADWLIENSLRGGPVRDLGAIEPNEADGAAARTETGLFEPALAPDPAQEARPIVNIVPGIAQLAIAGALHAPRRQAEVAVADALIDHAAMIAPPAAVVEAPVDAPIAAEPQISRAAEIAARARRMQSPPGDRSPSVWEPKPARAMPPFAPPFPRAPSEPAVVVGAIPEVVARTVAVDPDPPSVAFIQAPPPPMFHASRACGAHASEQGVIFRQPLTIGRSVCIAADFNNWSPEATPLRPHPSGAALEAFVPLDPGMYQYRLVIDGQWVPDAFNPATASNPFGGRNSIVCVPGTVAAQMVQTMPGARA